MTSNNEVTLIDQIAEIVKKRLHDLSGIPGITIRVIEPQRDSLNPSIVVDLESPSFIAKIIFWSIGTGQISAIDVAKKEMLFDYHCDIKQIEDLNPHLEKIIALYRI